MIAIIVKREFLDTLEDEIVSRDNHDGTVTLIEVNGAMVGVMSEYEYPPEDKGMYPPGSYGYKLCELAEEIENIKDELKKSLPIWLYKLLFWLA